MINKIMINIIYELDHFATFTTRKYKVGNCAQNNCIKLLKTHNIWKHIRRLKKH